MHRILCFIILVFCSSIIVAGDTINVSPAGPVRTISDAIIKAHDGDTIIVEGGSYNETLLINKRIKLTGRNRPAIIGDGTESIINVKAAGTTIEGFMISNSGSNLNREDSAIVTENSNNCIIQNNIIKDVLFGIYLKNSLHCKIIGNEISGKDLPIPDRGDSIRIWYSPGTLIKNNRIADTRDLVIWWSSETLIQGNIVERGRYGLHYMYSNNNVFKDNIFRKNLVGGFLMYSRNLRFENNIFIQNQGVASGYGVGFKDLDLVTAVGNKFIDNRVGIYMDNTPTSYDVWNDIRENKIAFNDIGASIMPSIERNRILQNSFIDNHEQVEVRGGGILKGNEWFAESKGNYWSDYKGYDSNKDGIGDFPYVAESLFENMMDKNSVLRLFIHSPVTNALDIAARAFPVFKPAPKFTDQFPLTSPAKSHIAPSYKVQYHITELVIYLLLISLQVLILRNFLKPYKRL